ncbi:uncharacterized protein LOC126376335 [Pectinophora gossypiella]|uniref:uncharacterized protein LOC126376335 n=1 Tax=Pectinophora gossypiella TaxID=13191 RepID=UPI00214F5572|nr:uncharacterized protein LOC126376335 [Pectinophora gossypiella]
MNPTNFKLAAGLVMSGIAAVKILKSITKRRDTTVNEVLLYGAEDDEKAKEAGLNNLFCIYYVIVHATTTVDVCMPNLLSDTIAKCLVNARRNSKVKIRVCLYKCNDVSQLDFITQSGIEVKVVREHLAHEFILVDAVEDCKETVAIIGSLDYDTKRVNCSRDNTMLTSEETVVKTLKKEFERIWESEENSA